MDLARKRVASAERVKDLVDGAFAARYQDRTAMLSISSRAVALAEEKKHEIPSDLRVAAWTQYGNALRITGRYEKAEDALERAKALSASDPSTKAHLLEITGNLHRNTGRFTSAIHLLNSAIEIQKSLGDRDSEGRVHNLLGITYLDSGDRRQALREFQTALNLLGPDAPLDVVAATGHNMVEALIADDRLAAATSALVLLEPYYRRLTPARLSAKAEWARARLCWKLKQFDAAQIAYERAYALLSTEPHCPELAELVKEMAELPIPSDPAG
jgi:tetratricopeptide (TPR) repeat protein